MTTSTTLAPEGYGISYDLGIYYDTKARHDGVIEVIAAADTHALCWCPKLDRLSMRPLANLKQV